MKKSSAIILALALALALAVSCNDPAKPVVKDDDSVAWPAMTSRDDVVRTILLAYANPKDGESIPRYNALLHSQYFFHLHEADVRPGEQSFLARAEDIAATEWIFDNQSMLELTIPEMGTWDVFEEIDGQACADCWESTREYRIRVQFSDEEMIYQSPAGSAFVTIIVSPDESDPEKWVLRAMYDMISY